MNEEQMARRIEELESEVSDLESSVDDLERHVGRLLETLDNIRDIATRSL